MSQITPSMTDTSARSGEVLSSGTILSLLGIKDESNFYHNNKALIYGDDIASFPQKIVKLVEGTGRKLQATGDVLESLKIWL